MLMSAPATEHPGKTRTTLIPWGAEGDTLAIDLPADWPEADVVWPDLSGVLDDYPAALRAALSAPAGCAAIEARVGPGSKVALVVDDPSRWTPVREALPLILDRLRGAGVRDVDITISAGVGRHLAVDDLAMRKRVGDDVASRHRCFSPPVDDLSAYADLGTTPDGVPVRVFRPVAEADLRILIGSVMPHLQAGFGGGYKLIFPGASHRSTLGALHRRGIGRDGDGDASRLLGGDPSSNPMRQAIRAAADLLGPCVSVSHLLGAPGQVLAVRAGHPDPVQDVLSAEARRRFRAPDAPPADLIVAGNHPWPGDPMQSFKVLLQHRASCRVGGVLVGFFWTDPAELDRSFPMPAMRAIAASGAVGGWSLRHGLALADRVAGAVGSPAAFMIHWARELVVDRAVLVYSPVLFERIGPRLGPIRLFADQPSLWQAAARALPGVTAPRVRIFPQGGLTYAAVTMPDAREIGAGSSFRKVN
jgi:lactate racemase